MATITKAEFVEQTNTTLLSTQFNGLASGSLTAAGSAINNAPGGTTNWNGNREGKVSLHLDTYTGTPSAGAVFNIWWLLSADGGTTYEDGSATVTPARPPDLIIPVRLLASGPQTVTMFTRKLPVGNFKPLAQNSMGIACGATNNTTLIVAPGYMQGDGP